MKTGRLCCKLLLVSSLINQAFAENVQVWLDRMSSSFRELTYQGTLSYQRGDHMQSLRIAHAVIEGKEFERLEYLDGKKREVLRRDQRLKCIHPGEKFERFFAASGATNDDSAATDLTAHYQVEMGAQGRIAGRDVVELNIIPKDEFRYGYRLALDDSTGLMVRSELLGGAGEVLERFQFVELDIGGNIQRDYFQAAGADYPPQAMEDNPASATAEELVSPWRVAWMPPGFVPINKGRSASRGDMFTFTDGMTVFSVFIEPFRHAKSTAVLEGNTTKGATSAYFKILQLADKPHRVTVVGEIPPVAARRIAESVVSTH